MPHSREYIRQLFRIANRLHNMLLAEVEVLPEKACDGLRLQISSVSSCLNRFQQSVDALTETCSQEGDVAAYRLRAIVQSKHVLFRGDQIASRVENLKKALDRLMIWKIEECRPVASLRSIVEGLLALSDHFVDVDLSLNYRKTRFSGEPRISVTTDDIELDGVPLGSFIIHLHIPAHKNSIKQIDHNAIEIEVGQPGQPTGCDDDGREHIHPHVDDTGGLCFGEGKALFNRLLQTGNISEAFEVVEAVLRTYNASSSYAAIDSWGQKPAKRCRVCRCRDDHSEFYECEVCDEVVCDDCAVSCACQESTSRVRCCNRRCADRCSLLTYCQADSCVQRLCDNCSETCRDCDKPFCDDCLVEDGDDRYCRDCLDRREKEANEIEETEDEEEEKDEEESVEAPVASGAASEGAPAVSDRP